MANACPSSTGCGTFMPGWLNGDLPSVPDGKVSRSICFYKRNVCCYTSVASEVRNCGGFYVYGLRPTPYCQMRYCGNGTDVVSSKLFNVLYSVSAGGLNSNSHYLFNIFRHTALCMLNPFNDPVLTDKAKSAK